MDVKKEFVLKALDDRVVFIKLCREYGIGTKCGYKWKKRFIARVSKNSGLKIRQ
jgi:transposase-like protein